MTDTQLRTVELIGGPFDGELLRIPAALARSSYRLPVPPSFTASLAAEGPVLSPQLSVAEYRYDGRTGAGAPDQWEDLVITMRYVA